MKKFVKIVALALAGTMMLMMTACCGGKPVTTEEILKEINAHREKMGVLALTEEEALSDCEQAYLDIFKEAGKTKINFSELDKKETAQFDALTKQAEEKWSWGYKNGAVVTADGVHELILPATSMDLVRFEIAVSGMFEDDWVDSIGIATTTIDGVTYWSFTAYYTK